MRLQKETCRRESASFFCLKMLYVGSNFEKRTATFYPRCILLHFHDPKLLFQTNPLPKRLEFVRKLKISPSFTKFDCLLVRNFPLSPLAEAVCASHFYVKNIYEKKIVLKQLKYDYSTPDPTHGGIKHSLIKSLDAKETTTSNAFFSGLSIKQQPNPSSIC